ncbi:hypothetical protein [Oceanobacillus saliphilus]|uniref:hypothetical protein n=1 Tax=Oceanobacillus saliphilus TaxID=2925834 RepID=UPI00201DB139|nr:hypothetical protein [Oceanobacillus saliphilus]
MKYMMMIVVLLFMLAACGDNDRNNNSPAVDNNDNVGTENAASVMFQNIDVKVEGAEFLLTGEASTTTDQFFYVIDQGDDVLMEEKNIPLNEVAPGGWVKFEINEKLPVIIEGKEDTPIITLYGKDENNQMVNPNYIPIDIGE